MRYRQDRRLKAQETEKAERRHGEGGGYGHALNNGGAAKGGRSVDIHRIFEGGVADLVARRPAADPGGVSVDRARGC